MTGSIFIIERWAGKSRRRWGCIAGAIAMLALVASSAAPW